MHLSPATLFRLARTCKAARAATLTYCLHAFDINILLLRFFTHPLAFRALQAATGTLISGSGALQFLDRTKYRSSDLDLYTHPGYAKDVGLWLIRSDGYRYMHHREGVQIAFEDIQCVDWCPWRLTSPPSETTATEQNYFYTGLHAVYSFEKTTALGKIARVQIMSAYNSPLQCIMAFHSSTFL